MGATITGGMGAVADIATSAPGYTSSRPNTCATVAEILLRTDCG